MEEKPVAAFPRRGAGFATRCKACVAKYLIAYKEANATAEGRAEFLSSIAAKKKLRAEASNNRKREWRANYEKRPEVVAYRANYKSRPDRIAITKAKNSRPEKLAIRAANSRKRRSADPKFLLHGRMSCLIRARLRSGKQGETWTKLVDYSLDELRTHIEKQFLPGMSWENSTKWHIDHIIPASSFNYESVDDEQFRRCWALTNLRPLWRTDNLKKGNKVETLL
jgi:hypothetical protein